MELLNYLFNHSSILVVGIVLLTGIAFIFDNHQIKKNQSEYSEEYRMFCLFLQTKPDQFPRTTVLELLNKARIYSFKYGHLPKAKRPQLMSLLPEEP